MIEEEIVPKEPSLFTKTLIIGGFSFAIAVLAGVASEVTFQIFGLSYWPAFSLFCGLFLRLFLWTVKPGINLEPRENLEEKQILLGEQFFLTKSFRLLIDFEVFLSLTFLIVTTLIEKT